MFYRSVVFKTWICNSRDTEVSGGLGHSDGNTMPQRALDMQAQGALLLTVGNNVRSRQEAAKAVDTAMTALSKTFKQVA
jgi:hypothetical protein